MKINNILKPSFMFQISQLQQSVLVISQIETKKNKRRFFSKKRKLDRSKLPSPLNFYKNLGIDLKGNGAWKMAKCPFHQDTNPSMSVNTIHGGFICHACGQSGDMLSFYMNFKHVDFISACNSLDLWER
jgi:hypothetical protein